MEILDTMSGGISPFNDNNKIPSIKGPLDEQFSFLTLSHFCVVIIALAFCVIWLKKKN